MLNQKLKANHGMDMDMDTVDTDTDIVLMDTDTVDTTLERDLYLELPYNYLEHCLLQFGHFYHFFGLSKFHDDCNN